MNESYHNLYWTGLISLQSTNILEFQRLSLSSHIIECLESLQQIDDTNQLNSWSIFNPADIIRGNPYPSIDEFALTEEQKYYWGYEGSKMR